MSPRVLDMTEGEGLRRCVLLRNAFRLCRSLEASRSTALSVHDLLSADSGYATVDDEADPYGMSVGVSDYDFGDDETDDKTDGTRATTTTTTATPASMGTKSEAQWFDELLFEMGSASHGDLADELEEQSDSDDELSDDEDEAETDFAPLARSTARRSRHPLAQVWPRRPAQRSAHKPFLSERQAQLDRSVEELTGLELDFSSLSTLSSAIPLPASSTPGAASLSSSTSSIDECPALVRDDGEEDESSSSDSEIDSDEGHGSAGADTELRNHVVGLRQHGQLQVRVAPNVERTGADVYQAGLRIKSIDTSPYHLAPSSSSTPLKASTTPAGPSLDLLRSVSSIRALSESAWRTRHASLLQDDEEEDELTSVWARQERVRAW